MFKKFTFSAIIIAAFLFLIFTKTNAQPPGSNPITVGSYTNGLGSTSQCYGGYWFRSPVDLWIVAVQVQSGAYDGPRSTQIYQFTFQPPSNGYYVYDSVYYPTYSNRMNPRWRIENYGSTGYEISNISSGRNYQGQVVNEIFVPANTYWGIYSQSQYPAAGYYYSYWSWCYRSYSWYTTIGGIGTYLYPSRGYYGYGYMSTPTWCTYSYNYTGGSLTYIGRTRFWYMLPCYIYVTQNTGGTIAPSAPYGPFKPGFDVNLDYVVTPDPGKHIVDVTLNGASVGAITRPVHTQHFGIVNTTQTISATYGNRIIATGYGTFMNPTGTSYYVTGSNPSYDVTPFPGAFITSITATGSVSGVINVPVLNSGTGQLIALGQPGYPFANLNEDWTLDVVCMMNLFTTTEQHGTINPLGSTDIVWGTLYPVQIIPDANYKVSHLYIDGFDVLDPTQPGYPHPGLDLSAWPLVTFNLDMSYSHTVHATFYAWIITPEVVGVGGTIEPSAPVKVYEHAQYPFNITPDIDWSIDSVMAINLSNGEISLIGNIPLHGGLQILFRDIINDWKLQVKFKIDRYNVLVKNARVMEGGKIFPTGTLNPESDDGLVIVNSGTDLNFTITADLGWNIKDVILDG
ncbi:MAG: hypothetical protein HZB41_14345, partial [Ignavibacteriae bacterium]|nr:hypothetical protein [Ignavibacteriota bacterium]